MRSRRLSLPPSLRIDAQLEMLSSKAPQGTVLELTCWYYRTVGRVLRYTYTLLNRTPARWY